MEPRQIPWLKMVVVLFCLLLLCSCSASVSSIANIRLFSVSVKVVDEANAPIAGAIVASNGQDATTDADGMAVLKFGAVGGYMINVTAQDRAPANLGVTMPLDMNKTMTARLGKPVDMSAGIRGGAAAANMSSMMMTAMYPMIFQSMFTAYGYSLEMIPYKPGEWTEWNFDSEKNDTVMRKAFLTKQDNNQEWWQVAIDGKKKEDKMTFEVLFSAARQSIRRMRQQTGDGQPSEVPVTEGWYSAPMQLTPESMEGSVVKKGVDVQVPAGKFKADILEFNYMGAQGKLRMWRATGVPGGLVRVELSGGSKRSEWVSELKAYGNGAKTLLGSY